MNADHRQWLMELTALPTAAGREQQVIAWVESWVRRRRNLQLRRDRHGNLLIQLTGKRSGRPLIITAHMDHPSFVVAQVESSRSLLLEFRGWVFDPYFPDSPVLLFHEGQAPARGVIELLSSSGEQDRSQRARARFRQDVLANSGDVVMWDTGEIRVEKQAGQELLLTRACDDVAGVAAALSALDELRNNRQARGRDVRVLLTRAEEVGFIGAIAACASGLIPRNARLINVENSKSFAESPIGGGPILRVGDRTSTFDVDLTYRCGVVAQALAQQDPSFRFQRRLMPGGTCEASAFQCFGYTATGMCLPLGNYHNMNEATQRIGPETISLDDFANLVRLLVAVGISLDDPEQAPPLRSRLEKIFADRKHLLLEGQPVGKARGKSRSKLAKKRDYSSQGF